MAPPRALAPVALVLALLPLACGTTGAPPGGRDTTDPGRALLDPADPTSLAGWRVLGDASFSRAGDELTGEGRHLPRNSFLAFEEPFDDFVLALGVRIEPGGNSGVQVRSAVAWDEAPGALVRGYQVEIDPSERAWSGGLYDEAGRAWLYPLEGHPEARAAFVPGAWNQYVIACEGARIRTWVNGVPCADWVEQDGLGARAGHLALQVHVGEHALVHWRAPRLWALAEWASADAVLARLGLDPLP